jgi:hypothetical protein
MFLAILAHSHEDLHKRHLVYCVRVTSELVASGLKWHSNPGVMSIRVLRQLAAPGLKWNFTAGAAN